MDSTETLRLLDRHIGVAVLGYRVHSEGAGSSRYYVLLDGNNSIVAHRTSADDGGRTSEAAAWDDCPPFSSDLRITNEMMSVIEERFPGVEFLLPGPADPHNQYTTVVKRNGQEFSGTGGSMEAAICRAVLAFVNARSS